MTTTKILTLLCAGFALAGCTGPVIMGGDAAVIILTRPSDPPPADTQDQITEHASWCYQTMGDIQCFAHPQNVPPDRLVNVDPQNLYPLDVPAYHRSLLDRPPTPPSTPAFAQPVSLQPAVDVQVEKANLSTELNSTPAPVSAGLPSQ